MHCVTYILSVIQYILPSYYATLHDITLVLWCTKLHCTLHLPSYDTAIHYITTQHYITLIHYITLCHINTLHCITLCHINTLHYIALIHYITLYCMAITLHYTAMDFTLCYIAFHLPWTSALIVTALPDALPGGYRRGQKYSLSLVSLVAPSESKTRVWWHCTKKAS